MIFAIKMLLFLLLSIQSLFPNHNEITKKNFSNSEELYRLIKQFLNQYQRPFTILEIGANNDALALRIAQDFNNAVCIMTKAHDQALLHKNNILLDACKTNPHLSNLIFLNKTFEPNELQHLSECEHFDITLAINVLQNFGDQWQEALDAILNMGDYAIIEVSDEFESQSAITDYILTKNGKIFGSNPGNNTTDTLYIIPTFKKHLQRKTWFLPKMKKKNYVIESSFTEKKLKKTNSYWPPSKEIHISAWLPGINLITFKMCNGAHPPKETIKMHLQSLKESPHTDWMINNIIIQGNKLVWIDIDDISRSYGAILKPTHFSEQGMRAHQKLIDLDDPQKIEHYFWHTLIRTPVQKKHRVKFFGKFITNSSTVFDIAPEDDTVIETYLGYGAKVFCFDVLSNSAGRLSSKFKDEDVIVVTNDVLKHHVGSTTLDAMITLYQCPHFCNIHLEANEVYSVLRGLSQEIPYIAFKFALQALDSLEKCLQHLENLGYSDFNFSARDIPLFILDNNIHTGVKKKWVHSAQALLREIKHAASLDYDAQSFHGYIYAHCH